MPRIRDTNSKRTYVTLTDAKTRRSKGLTIEDMSPAEVAKFIRKALVDLRERKEVDAA